MNRTEMSSSVASLLLVSWEEALFDVQQTSVVNERSSVDYLMKQVFLKAGISLTSSTALEVHSKIFRELFITPSRKSDMNLLSTSRSKGGASQLSMLQYFTLLRSEELDWLHFHKELMPYLRLSDATKVMVGLADFYKEKVCEELNITDVKLLLSGLTTMLGIFLDFLASDRSYDVKEQCSMTVEKQNQKEKIDNFLKPGAYCLKTILRLLQQHNILSDLIRGCDVCKEIFGILSLILILLGPSSNAKEVKQSLFKVYMGKVYLTNFKEEFTKKNDKLRRKGQFKEYKEKSNLINFTESKESGLDVIINKGTERKTNSESEVSTISTSRKYSETTLSELMILCFRSSISVSLFHDVITFFCRGELNDNCAFYQLFSDFLCNEENVYINKHLLDGYPFHLLLIEELVHFDKFKNNITIKSQKAECGEDSEGQNFLDALTDSNVKSEQLSSSDDMGSENFETEPLHLATMSDLVGILSSSEVRADGVNDRYSLFYKLAKLFAERPSSLPTKFLDISQLKLTNVDHLVQSGRGLLGEEDLKLVKKAVTERICGWRDLLAKGLENQDLEGWWNVGFYDLAWQHEAVLCSETNVSHILNFLQTLSEQDMKEGHSVSDLTKLFSVMFRRLPTLIQEHLVSSYLSPHEHSVESSIEQKGSLQVREEIKLPLSRLKTEKQILLELTSTLNRLTMSNLKELLPQILQLCLYHTNAVIRQTLFTAVENKGQVTSLVEVLRWMPTICRSTNPSHQSLISQCLCEVLMETELSEVRTQNIIKLITLLTQDYSQSMEPWYKAERQLTAVLSPREFLLHVIVPSLVGQSHGNDQQEKKSQDMLPLHVCLSVLASVLNSAAGVKLGNRLVLLRQLLTVHVSSHQMFSDGQFDELKFAERQSSLKCIELLISAFSSDDQLLEASGYRWLGQEAIKTGLLATALVYPLLKTRCDLEMKTVLEKMVGILNSSPEKSAGILISLAQLALANDELCAEVTELVGNMTRTLDGQWAITLTSHLLMTSLSCQAPRVGRLLLALAENSHLCFQTPVEFDLYPTEKSFSSKGTLLIKVHQLVSAAVLHLISWDLTVSSVVHIMSNYQSFSQVLLSDLPTGDEASQVLEQYFGHYCLLMSRLEGPPAQVLKVSSLDVLTKLKNLQSTKRKAKDSSRCAYVRGGDAETLKKGIDLELVDFVACVKEESIMTELMKQVQGLKL